MPCDYRPRGAAAQFERYRCRNPARPDDGVLRPVGLGQEFAGHGHGLRRRAASLRRVLVGLCAAVCRPVQKPRLDHIEGLSPAIAIEQKHMGHTPRSTVGTVTEVYDYLRILFARLGQPYCPSCDIAIGTQTADEIIDRILQEPAGTGLPDAPQEVVVGENYASLWDELRKSGYQRMRVDGATHSIESPPAMIAVANPG